MWLLFGIGAVVMRGAGCAFNDIVDRDIDAQVARTARPPDSVGRDQRAQAAASSSIVLCLIGLVDPAAVQLVRGRRWARPRCCWSRPIPS